jgi:proline dehydrogenase
MYNRIFDDTQVAFKMKKNFHLYNAIFLFNIITRKLLVTVFTNLTLLMLKMKLPVKWILKRTIYKHFCGGVDLIECQEIISGMHSMNVHSILDYSIEGQKNELSFENSCKKKIDIINSVSKSDAIPFAVFKPSSIGRYDLFKLISSEINLSIAEEEEWLRVVSRFHKICNHAMKMKIKILIDAEEFEVQKAIDDLAVQMMSKYNVNNVIVYNTVQMYRWDRLGYLKELINKNSKSKFKLGFKLVRGAYMEKERLLAKKGNYKSPICSTKLDTDKNFDLAVEFMFDNIKKIDFFVATHNENSNYKVMELMNKNSLQNSTEKIWFGQLYGMSDNITFNLAKLGYNVAKILPFGPVENLVPYLIRRAQENSSFEGQSSRELNLLRKELKRRYN